MVKKNPAKRTDIGQKFFKSKFSGFSLVELVVVIAILAILTVGIIITVNPKAQINKVNDSKRQRDIQEIKKALDTYYSDFNCYPGASSNFVNSLNTGSQWREGSAIYMQKVPSDPNLTAYIYVVDSSSSCPQWNVLFARLSRASSIATTCPLSGRSDCVSLNVDNTWACVTSGIVDCSKISALPTPVLLPTNTPSPTNTPIPTPTFTPTPTPCQKNYACRGTPLRCNIVNPSGSGDYCASDCNGVCP